ncbi:hypothetical protein CK221_02055 [Mesorhizobium sp. WSM3868]|nr:hypothetical protein CK221_02055 [Mesorhizobium sp. WSM3868]
MLWKEKTTTAERGGGLGVCRRSSENKGPYSPQTALRSTLADYVVDSAQMYITNVNGMGSSLGSLESEFVEYPVGLVGHADRMSF